MSGQSTLLEGSLFDTVYTFFGAQSDNELIYKMSCCATLGTIVTGIFTALQPAPYGKFSKSWTGPSINAKLAWLIQDVPALVVPFLLMYQSPWVWKMNVQNALLTILFISHYVQRCLVYPMRMREAAKPVPILTIPFALLITAFNGFFQCHHLMNVEKVENSVFLIPGVTLFIIGMAINVHHDGILLGLKRNRTQGDKNERTEYKIPRGALFELVSGANYLGEIMEWWGLAVASGKVPQLIFAVFATVYLGVRAFQHHQFYKKTFGVSYPTSRMALIPYVM